MHCTGTACCGTVHFAHCIAEIVPRQGQATAHLPKRLLCRAARPQPTTGGLGAAADSSRPLGAASDSSLLPEEKLRRRVAGSPGLPGSLCGNSAMPRLLSRLGVLAPCTEGLRGPSMAAAPLAAAACLEKQKPGMSLVTPGLENVRHPAAAGPPGGPQCVIAAASVAPSVHDVSG